MILRDYQEMLVNETTKKLNDYGIAYLTLETRVGKTPVSLVSAERFAKPDSVIYFLTKKSVIPSIQKTLSELGDQITKPVVVMSFDSLHKLKHNKN